MNRRQIMLAGGAAILAGGGAATYAATRTGSLDAYAAQMAELRRPIAADGDDLELIRLATLAANGHNTQPWRFRPGGGAIAIEPDFSRRTPVVDPDDHHLFASLGCAAENLALAAAAQGRGGALDFDGGGEGRAVFQAGQVADAPADLVAAIPHRQSTRAEYDGRPVAASDLRALADASRIDGVDLVLITDHPSLSRVRDLIVAGNTAQMADPAFVRELKDWLRFSPRQTLARGDGLFTAASGNPVAPPWLGRTMFDLFFKAEAENEKYARQMASSAGVAVFLAERDDPEHWVRAGRACQRFALKATALGLKHAFVNQPVEVAGLRPDLAALAGLPGRRPDIVMRFGYGDALPWSPRRPVEAVLAG
jgi:nitroreductase